jgi:3',5'-cyclic AMP phosphodiesterase CpdA
MRTLVHLSDLHFGRFDDRIVTPLIQRLRDINPDVIAISGDLTQRALRGQFVQARAFLDALPFPKLIVPGNHDVPFYNVPARLLNPFGPYRRFIAEDLEPIFVDDEIAVVGLNSARGLVIHGRGRLNEVQVQRAADRLRPLPTRLIRVIVTHHPFDLPEGFPSGHLVGRAEMAVARLVEVGADLFLAGHLHLSHIGHTAERYKIAGHSALVVQAGTLSTRERGEANTFNVLQVARPDMSIDRYTWDTTNERFVPSWSGKFHHTEHGWTPAVPG